MEGEFVDLDDDSVDLVLDAVTMLAVVLDEVDRLRLAVRNTEVRARG